MASIDLERKASAYLRRLCVEIGNRRVGSAGNRAATDWFSGAVAAHGWATECPPFECIDWEQQGADLTAAGGDFQVFPSPYSLGCRAVGPLVVVSSLEALEAADLARAIVLLRGELAREQLMPKNFSFYNPEHHQRIIHLLESKAPQAIVAATSRDAEMVGSAVYPFPLIEDGDFDIPSMYMTEEEGERLAAHEGREVRLESGATRIPARGCNVIARKGPGGGRRVVVFAHIDSRMGTPGATDNATGVTVLVLLAELLAGYEGPLGLELVALNGEDYYANPGEMQYLARNEGRWEEIVLGINVDGAGYDKGRAAYSLYDCPPPLAEKIRRAMAGYPGLVEGEPWVQGDHGLFLINRRPALAVTSEMAGELLAQITHTPRDTVEIVSPMMLVQVAAGLRELLAKLGDD